MKLIMYIIKMSGSSKQPGGAFTGKPANELLALVLMSSASIQTQHVNYCIKLSTLSSVTTTNKTT